MSAAPMRMVVGRPRISSGPHRFECGGTDFLGEAEWLIDEKRLPLVGVERILIRAQDVEMVELMQVEEAADSSTDKKEDPNGRS